MAASRVRAAPSHGSLLTWSGSRMAASPSTGTSSRTRRLKRSRKAGGRCSATGSLVEFRLEETLVRQGRAPELSRIWLPPALAHHADERGTLRRDASIWFSTDRRAALLVNKSRRSRNDHFLRMAAVPAATSNDQQSSLRDVPPAP